MRGTAAERPDLAELRAAVYRPGATSSDVAALERATGELAMEQSASAAHPDGPSDDPADHDLAASAGSAHLPVQASVPRLHGRRRSALAVVAATLAGVAAGAVVVLLAQPSGARATVPTTVHISTSANGAVFQRPQRADDRPDVRLDPALVRSSLRRLLSAGRIQLYAAEDVQGRRCLVGVQGGAAASCVAAGRFRQAGVRLLWSSDVRTVDSVGLRELWFRLALVAEWRPDGAVTLGAVRR